MPLSLPLSRAARAVVLSLATAATSQTLLGDVDSLYTSSTNQGPSTSRTPYVVPVATGVRTVSIFTVGTQDRDGTTGPTNGSPDSVSLDTVNLKSIANGDPLTQTGNAYIMAGKPDGLGLMDNGDGTFTVLMNHELGTGEGITRAHGAIGAYVSKWTVNGSNLAVSNGQDLIRNISLTNTSGVYQTAASGVVLGNLCSADLPALSALYNSTTGLGYNGRIFFSGEENSTGRSFAHVVTGANAGTSFELPRFGRQQVENILLNPTMQNLTIVAVNEDLSSGTTPVGQVNFYIGTKTNTGNAAERAGLNNGTLYGLRLDGLTSETLNGSGLNGVSSKRFELVTLPNQTGKTAGTLASDVTSNNIMNFLRPEDGAWDPSNPNDYYFVSTGNSGSNPSSSNFETRLWRVRFDSITAPTSAAMDGKHGTLEMMFEGGTGTGEFLPINMDNMTITRSGKIVIQEDPGNTSRAARIWLYDIATDTMEMIARADPARFGDKIPTAISSVSPFGQQEETSGIIDAWDILGPGWFLLTVQAHYGTGGLTTEMDEGGQLLAMFIPQAIPEPTSIGVLGLGALAMARSRRRR